jgi:hypothetical protein
VKIAGFNNRQITACSALSHTRETHVSGCAADELTAKTPRTGESAFRYDVLRAHCEKACPGLRAGMIRDGNRFSDEMRVKSDH